MVVCLGSLFTSFSRHSFPFPIQFAAFFSVCFFSATLQQLLTGNRVTEVIHTLWQLRLQLQAIAPRKSGSTFMQRTFGSLASRSISQGSLRKVRGKDEKSLSLAISEFIAAISVHELGP